MGLYLIVRLLNDDGPVEVSGVKLNGTNIHLIRGTQITTTLTVGDKHDIDCYQISQIFFKEDVEDSQITLKPTRI